MEAILCVKLSIFSFRNSVADQLLAIVFVIRRLHGLLGHCVALLRQVLEYATIGQWQPL